MIHEFLAGLSTFFTMAYLLILCPEILSAGGLDFGAVLTGTILTLSCTTLFLALFANYPLVIGPGIGVAAFLVFSVVEHDHATIEQVLGLVFWAGLILLLLSITGLRQKILEQLPWSLKKASSSGLGLFFIAVGCKQLELLTIDANGYSLGTIGTPGQLIGILGLILLIVLHRLFFRISFLVPILFCWGTALFFHLSEWRGIFSLPPSPSASFLILDLGSILTPQLWTILLSILLITLFDTGATLTALTRALNWMNPDGSIQNVRRALIPDGIGSMLGALLGTTSCTFYAESSSGIRAGGRTWIVSCTVVICSLIALFFYPLLSSIPLFATAPALIGLGGLMTKNKEWTAWHDRSEWIPFVVTALAMPVFFNIYLGFALGFISFVVMKVLYKRRKEIRPLVWVLTAIFTAHLWLIRF